VSDLNDENKELINIRLVLAHKVERHAHSYVQTY